MSEKIVAPRSSEAAREGLEVWFAASGHAGASVQVLPGPEATGYSHDTIVFDVTTDGSTQRLVARVEPEELSVFPSPDLSLEYRLLEALADTDVSLPVLHGFEPDPSVLGAPFYVMQHIQGMVPPDTPPYTMGGWLYDATPDERAQVWWSGLEALTRPHLVDPAPLDFINAGRTPGFDGELEYWANYIDFCGGEVSVVARRAWDWLRANKPGDTSTALCWGDSRLGNQMFDGGRCVALLDWEMACLSDPVQDLAWFIHFDELFSGGLGMPRLEGLPTREETVARYEELTGSSVKNLGYFDVFAAFRFVLILQRLGSLQIATGKAEPDSTFPTDNFATANLSKLCDEKGIR